MIEDLIIDFSLELIVVSGVAVLVAWLVEWGFGLRKANRHPEPRNKVIKTVRRSY